MEIIKILLAAVEMLVIIAAAVSFLALFVTLVIGIAKSDYTYFKKNLKIFGISFILTILMLILWGIFRAAGYYGG